MCGRNKKVLKTWSRCVARIYHWKR